MKKVLPLLAFLLLSAVAASAATPAQLMQQCAAKLAQAPSATMKFTVVPEQGEPVPFTLTLGQEKFRLSNTLMEVWYDGTTMWTLLRDRDELTLSEPTAEELLESNPMSILAHWQQMYTAGQGRTAHEVYLKAKNPRAPITDMRITIDPATALPQKLLVTMANGHTFSALVGSAATGKAVPASTFKYDARLFPAKETIDLR